MSALASAILTQLDEVARLRAQWRHDAEMGRRVLAVKTYQQRRFERTHADLLRDGRHGAAARFFLDDLYGPQDFAERDAQFARVVPALVRMFPNDLVETVLRLATLHALTENLDSEIATRLPDLPPDAEGYVRAWQATGRHEERQQQIALVLSIGQQLDKATRNRFLRQTLKLMRGPARAAGLSTLQAFLERGFDTFAAMGGAQDFLALIELRERALVNRLFEADAAAAIAAGGNGVTDAIGQLP
jgi:hypothetical protein